MPEDTGTVDDAQETTDPNGPEEAPVETPQGEETQEQTDIDWRKRYEDIRPETDRWRTTAKQYEQVFQDPATLARAIKATGLSEQELVAALGYEIEGTPEEPETGDPLESDVAQLKAFVEQQQQAAQAAELEELEVQYFDQEITKIEKAEGRDLSEQEIQAIVALAEQMPDEQGLPQVEAAHKQLQALVEARQKAYLESKKAPAVPLGQPGSESIDLSDENKRLDALAQVAQAALDSE